MHNISNTRNGSQADAWEDVAWGDDDIITVVSPPTTLMQILNVRSQIDEIRAAMKPLIDRRKQLENELYQQLPPGLNTYAWPTPAGIVVIAKDEFGRITVGIATDLPEESAEDPDIANYDLAYEIAQAKKRAREQAHSKSGRRLCPTCAADAANGNGNGNGLTCGIVGDNPLRARIVEVDDAVIDFQGDVSGVFPDMSDGPADNLPADAATGDVFVGDMSELIAAEAAPGTRA